MLTNASITIFNQYPERMERRVVFIPHYIEKVWLHTKQKTAVVDGGLKSADEYLIRIPYGECGEWLSPNNFREFGNPNENWTVQNGDFFIVGRWDGKENISGIEEIKKEFSGVTGKILSHSENFFGSSKHIRIGGGS